MSGSTTGTFATQMAAGGITRLYDAIEAVVPGVVHPVVQMAIWDAIDEFCMVSTFWRRTLSWTMPAPERILNLNPIDGYSTAVFVLKVQGLTTFEVSPPATLVDMSPTVTQARAGWALVACKPIRLSDNTGTLPSFLVDMWFEAIKDGALMKLYIQPSKPYTNEQAAKYHGARYRSAMQRAKDMANRYWTNGSSGWSFPLFARGRRKN